MAFWGAPCCSPRPFGTIAVFAAQGWYDEHISHASSGHLFEIGFAIGGNSIHLTTNQALAACGGAAVVMFSVGIAACYLATSRSGGSGR